MKSRGDETRYDTVELAGVTLSYCWCHSRRKTFGITVRPDKSVSVRVPLRTPLKDVRAFVASRAEWLQKVWKKLDARPTQRVQEYGRCAVFIFQGKAYRLEFAKGPQRSLHLYGDLLILAAPEILPEETVRKLIDNWYRKQAAEIVSKRSIECHQLMRGEGIPLPPITIRAMKTRWGSYSYRTRRITINLSLIKAPQTCLDYVIIHELAHIKVRHHGPDFWRMVGCYMPDYLTIRKQLRQYI